MAKHIICSLLLSAFIAIPNLQAAEAPAKPERKQETVALGNNRFLIFVGEPNGSGFAYTADLVVVSNGVPRLDPVFTEEYDVDSNSINLSEGIAFQAENYHFDKATSMLDYTTLDTDKHARFQHKYNFNKDIFTLSEVIMQKDANSCETPPCETTMPKSLYKAKK